MTKDQSFLPHIEGIRAFAILAVLAFHYRLAPCFAGGFVGVDVFFVISGYLITKNISAQAMSGNFSFRHFYIRRSSRLLPALFFVITLTLAAGIYFSSPADLQHLAESAMSAIFSVSNFYFWSQSGYFDTSAIQKPLLHTWALSVEWQFYLLWPLIIILLFRYCKSSRYILAGLTVIGILSFMAAEMAINKDVSGAFYLTPYRIGEFAAGSLCALVPQRREIKGALGNILIISGFGLFFYAVFHYDEAVRFPGLASLLPCAGAFLLIRFGGSGIGRMLLSNPLSVGLGRISYSLYLVHWPLYVFYRQGSGGEPGTMILLIISAVSVAVAVGMYRLIEQPFRFHRPGDRRASSASYSLKLIAGLTICLIAVSASMCLSKGWAWRFPDSLARFAKEAEDEKNNRYKLLEKLCNSENSRSCAEPSAVGINVFVIGDSHAPDALNALHAQYPQYHYILKQMSGCPPLVREDYNLLTVKHPDRTGCINRNEALLYQDQLSQADLVVINTVFSWYKPVHLKHTIIQIRKKTNAPIIVMGNYMFFNRDVPDMVISYGSTSMNDHYKKNLMWHSFAFDNELKFLAEELGFIFVSKKELLCHGEDCPLLFNDKLFTYDRHHFSMAAAQQMGVELKARYNKYFLGLANGTTENRQQENFN